jgi:D-arabinitol dehydrogenase (NADP+)
VSAVFVGKTSIRTTAVADAAQIGGAGHVTIAANKGLKMDLARQLDAADAYIDLDRQNAKSQWEQIKKENPCEWCDPRRRALSIGHFPHINDRPIPFHARGICACFCTR